MGTVCCTPLSDSPLTEAAQKQQNNGTSAVVGQAQSLSPQAVAKATAALLQALRAPPSCTVPLWTREVASVLSEQVFVMQRALSEAGDHLEGVASDGAPLQSSGRGGGGGGLTKSAADRPPARGPAMIMDLHYFVVFDPCLFEPEDDSLLPPEPAAQGFVDGAGSMSSLSSSDLNNLERDSDEDVAFDRSAIVSHQRPKRVGRGTHQRRKKTSSTAAGGPPLLAFSQLISTSHVPRSPVLNTRTSSTSIVAVRAAHCSATTSSLESTFLSTLLELVLRRTHTASDPLAATASTSTGSRRHLTVVPTSSLGGPPAARYGHFTLPLLTATATSVRDRDVCSVVFASHACAVRDRQRFGTNILACRKGVMMEGTVVVWRQQQDADRAAVLSDDQDVYDDIFGRQANTEGAARSIFQRVATLAR